VNDYTCKVQSHFKTTKINKEDCRFLEALQYSHGQTKFGTWSDVLVWPCTKCSAGRHMVRRGRQTLATHMIRRDVRSC